MISVGLKSLFPEQGDNRGATAKEGGLSQALRSDGKAVAPSHVTQKADGASQQGAGSGRVPESSPMGRSPSRNFVSANHLLNFQYDRASVRLAIFHLVHVKALLSRANLLPIMPL